MRLYYLIAHKQYGPPPIQSSLNLTIKKYSLQNYVVGVFITPPHPQPPTQKNIPSLLLTFSRNGSTNIFSLLLPGLIFKSSLLPRIQI